MNKMTPSPERLTPEDLDAIRDGVDWRVLFEGLGLQKADKRSKPDDWWAFSPFHEENEPSFHIRPGGVWYDFSRGIGGGPIELIQALEACNCYEAGRILVERGWTTASFDDDTDIPSQRASQGSSHASQDASQTSSQVSRSTSELLCDGDGDTLNVTELNAPIRQTLLPLCAYHDVIADRGVTEETCALLGIGYLAQGRSPLRGRVVFQVRDARVTARSDGERVPVILSHLGRAAQVSQNPKYLFYEGFHKSAELFGQDLLWLDEDAATDIRRHSSILLTEGPFDAAKAIEAGLRNVVASFGASLSATQALKLAILARHHGVRDITIAYDRDEPGREGAAKAAERLTGLGLRPQIFDWTAEIGCTADGPAHIPQTIGDPADCSAEQLAWLRQRGLLRALKEDPAMPEHILAKLPAAFNRAAFEVALAAEASGPHNPIDARAALQAFKRKGLVRYDRTAKVWRKSPLVAAPVPATSVTAALKAPTKRSLQLIARTKSVEMLLTPLDRITNAFRIALTLLVCSAAVMALVAINASFAWALGESETFRIAFVAGLTASDLMRPLLVTRGLLDLSRRRFIRCGAAITVALLLAPVSILSSTSVISATLLLGAEENAATANREATLSALRPAYNARLEEVERARAAWKEECSRGGCGPVASRLDTAAEAIEEDQRAILSQITSLTTDASGQSGFIARTVASFEAAGLFGPDRRLLVPLLLAMTLEMAALFGPGLLLGRR